MELSGGLDEMQTHGIIVVVAEGVSKAPMGSTVGLVGYRKG